MCWHKDALYATDYAGSILCWKPGDPASTQQVAGGARLTGIADLGSTCDLSISPTGEIFVADFDHERLVSFQNGSQHLLLDTEYYHGHVCCFSPNGVLYVLNDTALQKLVGSTLQTMITFGSSGLKFSVAGIFVTKEEVIYFSDGSKRILRINPAESLEAVVVGEIPEQCEEELWDLFATEGETIYVADEVQRKVLAFRLGSSTFTEVLQCPDLLLPKQFWFMGDRCM